MTPTPATQGQRGEQMAAELLAALGYKILERNFRAGRAELDLVAFHEQALVCIEVKARNTERFGYPEQFVTGRKTELLVEGLDAYAAQIGWQGRRRYDEVALLLTEDGARIRIFEDVRYD